MKKQLLVTAVFCILGLISYSQDPIVQDSLTQDTRVQITEEAELIETINAYQSNRTGGYIEVDGDTLKRKVGLEIGLNVSPLLQRIISPATPFNSNGQELIMFNVKVGESCYWRNGFNSTLQKSTDLQENEFTSSFNSTFVRSGFEWRSPLSNKLELHYGVDALLDRFVSKFDFDGGPGNTSTTERISNGLGIGIPLGMTYWFNDKISLWVESSLIGTRSKMTDISTFDGEEVSKQESNFSNFRIKLPVSLFVKMAF